MRDITTYKTIRSTIRPYSPSPADEGDIHPTLPRSFRLSNDACLSDEPPFAVRLSVYRPPAPPAPPVRPVGRYDSSLSHHSVCVPGAALSAGSLPAQTIPSQMENVPVLSQMGEPQRVGDAKPATMILCSAPLRCDQKRFYTKAPAGTSSMEIFIYNLWSFS